MCTLLNHFQFLFHKGTGSFSAKLLEEEPKQGNEQEKVHYALLYTLGRFGQQIGGISCNPWNGSGETTSGMLQPVLSSLSKWMLKNGEMEANFSGQGF